MQVRTGLAVACCALLTACSSVVSGSSALYATPLPTIGELVAGAGPMQWRQVAAEWDVRHAPVTLSPAATAGTGICRSVNTSGSRAVSACETAAVRRRLAAPRPCAPAKSAIADSDPGQPLVACNHDRTQLFLLAPAAFTGEVEHADPVNDTEQGWLVQLTFTGRGSSDFAALTTAVTQLDTPLNQLAVVLNGVALSAPVIRQAIDSGNAEITGGSAPNEFTQAYVTALADRINATVSTPG